MPTPFCDGMFNIMNGIPQTQLPPEPEVNVLWMVSIEITGQQQVFMDTCCAECQHVIPVQCHEDVPPLIAGKECIAFFCITAPFVGSNAVDDFNMIENHLGFWMAFNEGQQLFSMMAIPPVIAFAEGDIFARGFLNTQLDCLRQPFIATTFMLIKMECLRIYI